jgi:hypothetical protein
MSIAISGSSITFPDQTQMSTAVGNSFRNRIYNGDMRIDQRNAGASVTNPANLYTLDRFASSQSQASKYSVQQNAGAVTPPSGFTNYLGVTSLSAYTVGSSENFAIYQPIEGFNVSDLDWGKATAKTVTLSFWVRSSLTGTFGVSLMNSAQNRSYPASYTINTADTWEYKTISISGDTSGTWLTTNGVGIYLFIGLCVGSASSGASGSWAGATYFGVTGATSVVGTNGATFYITGVQLEQGSTATEFERRPIGVELSLCQRYYWRMSSAAITKLFFQGYMFTTTQLEGLVPFPVPMRSQPTMSSSPVSQFSLRITGTIITALFGYATTGEFVPYTQMLLYTTNPAAGFIGYGQSLMSNSATATFIQFNSEL